MVRLYDVIHVRFVAVVGGCAVVEGVEVRMRVHIVLPLVISSGFHFYCPIYKEHKQLYLLCHVSSIQHVAIRKAATIYQNKYC